MHIPVIGWDIGLSPLITGTLIGLVYAILAAGLVLIYRTTRVINFAHGEVGAFGATLLAKMVLDWHWNYWLALISVLVVGAALGAIIDVAVVRRLFRAPRIVLLVATIGVGQVAFLGRIELPQIKSSAGFPTPLNREAGIGSVLLHSQDFMVIAFVPAVIVGLTLFLTRTSFGIAIRASADNGDRAELAGIRIRRISTTVWAIGGALAVLSVVLINPLVGAVPGLPTASVGPGLIFRALVAALVGGLVSLPRAFIGGIAIGILESIFAANNAQPGLIDVVLVVVALGLVLIRHTGIDDSGSGNWSVSGRVKAVPRSLQGIWWVRHLNLLGYGVVLILACVLPFLLTSSAQTFSLTQVLVYGIVGLSITVLAGWAGQLTLGQFALVGVGALTATTTVAHGLSFPIAVAYAAVVGGVGALVIGFPALRVRGPFLAVTTLGFAVAAQAWLYSQPIFGKGPNYLLAPSKIFGLFDMNSQRTFYFVCLVILVLATAAVGHLRRTGVGRRIIAVRDNQPSAASFGVSPTVTKLGVFIFSGVLAGLAGALLAGAIGQFQLTSLNSPPIFAPDVSLLVISMVVIGGIGSIPGAILGAVFVIGIPAIFGNSVAVNLATSGIGLLFLILYFPGGLMQPVYLARDTLLARMARRVAAIPAERQAPRPGSRPEAAPRHLPVRARRTSGELAEQVLRVENVEVRFGGAVALRNACIEANRGEIVGLIGSNGAGKSTLMNVISGFITPTSGVVSLNGADITDATPHLRARLGIGRVFQDARLFGDLTLREVVKVAMEPHEQTRFVPSLLALPPSPRAERVKESEADAYIDFLGLGRYADTYLSELSTGTRRIVEMCGLLAQGAELLLLDEPTAGVAQKETEAFGPLIKRIQSELGATVVIIEHDIPLIMSISDRVYCFAAGERIAAGLPHEVRDNPAVVAAYLGTDQRAIERSGTVSLDDTVLHPESVVPD